MVEIESTPGSKNERGPEMRTDNKWTTAVGAAALLVATVQLRPREVTAADHADGPMVQGDPASDILDFFAWHTDDDTIVAILTYAPDVGDVSLYDETKLYTINIDNTYDPASADPALEDNTADIQIRVYDEVAARSVRVARRDPAPRPTSSTARANRRFSPKPARLRAAPT